MDLQSNKAVIINACVGSWYPKGTERLVKSLNYVGWGGEVLTWANKWPNNNFNTVCPYNIKAAAFEEACLKGYSHILWCDSSVWAIQDPMPIFDIINEQGYYFWKSGYNCAQTVSDKALEYFGVTRDEAEKYEGCSSGIMGVNLKSEIGLNFCVDFVKAAKHGVFEGSREHDNQSEDPRFLFHRQDQSVASMLIGIMGLKMHDPQEHCSYYQKEVKDSVIFLLRGM